MPNIMDKESIFPEIRLFKPVERIKKIAHFLFDHIQSAPDHISDHYRPAARQEHELGHLVLEGEISAEEAYEQLGLSYEQES